MSKRKNKAPRRKDWKHRPRPFYPDTDTGAEPLPWYVWLLVLICVGATAGLMFLGLSEAQAQDRPIMRVVVRQFDQFPDGTGTVLVSETDVAECHHEVFKPDDRPVVTYCDFFTTVPFPPPSGVIFADGFE